MTNRSFLKCEVCGAITLMRLQAGWPEEHPLRVPCGRCGILISGTHQGAVSHKHLNYYLDEFTFRFNRRRSKSRGKLFFRLVQQAVNF